MCQNFKSSFLRRFQQLNNNFFDNEGSRGGQRGHNVSKFEVINFDADCKNYLTSFLQYDNKKGLFRDLKLKS